MKIIIILIIGALLLVLFYFSFLAYKSHKGAAPGLTNNQLSPCPDTPNCLNSEYPNDTAHFIDAMTFKNESRTEISQQIQHVIKNTGGTITQVTNNYIAAEFSTQLFRYVDDFEIRIDNEANLIHFRSASRVGKSDFGTNLKRIEMIKRELALVITAQ